MKVIAAINGSMVSESAAFLALAYAKAQGIELLLLHVKNHKDAISDVEKSALEIEKAAQEEGVHCETLILKGHVDKAIRSFAQTVNIDTFFCSTRMKSHFIVNSFSERILKLGLDTDIAVVRIVRIHAFREVDAILLPIKQAKLSVKKFTFLATLASTYKSEAQIYSISPASKSELSRLDLSQLRERLSQINFKLRHYMNLSRLMPFNLHIKHEFSSNETQTILTHMARYEFPLIIIGAKRYSFFSFFKGEAPIEQLLRETSENVIAYYPKED